MAAHVLFLARPAPLRSSRRIHGSSWRASCISSQSVSCRTGYPPLCLALNDTRDFKAYIEGHIVLEDERQMNRLGIVISRGRSFHLSTNPRAFIVSAAVSMPLRTGTPGSPRRWLVAFLIDVANDRSEASLVSGVGEDL